jgi:hypothetical protein
MLMNIIKLYKMFVCLMCFQMFSVAQTISCNLQHFYLVL